MKFKPISKPLLSEQRTRDLLRFGSELVDLCRTYHFALRVSEHAAVIEICDELDAALPEGFEYISQCEGFDSSGIYERDELGAVVYGDLRPDEWMQEKGEAVWMGPFEPAGPRKRA